MRHLIDLTHPIHNGMPTTATPWHPITEVIQLGRHCYEGRESYKVVLGSHTGTHMDSPAHMIENGFPRIDQIPLDILVGPAKMLNIPKGSYGRISVGDLEGCGVNMQAGDRIVVNTGWYKQWMKQTFYREWPSFEPEAVEWLVEKGIRMVAMDTPSPDNPLDTLEAGKPNPMHFALLSRGVIIVEYMNNLDAVTVTEFELYALPLLMKDLDGFPLRAIASWED